MFRYPDKPTTSSLGVLDHLVDGEWLADLKYDGWRALIRWDGNMVTFTSRHRKALPGTPGLLLEARDCLHGLPPALLDGEWMGRRDDQPESLVFFDMLEIGAESCWSRTADDRRTRLVGMIQRLTPRIRMVEYVDRGYRDFFERSKVPGCVGIVLKRKDSKLIGSIRNSVDNPNWLKVKWREGFDGQTRV
jgi:ATP-dependent DNA ligase